MLGIYLDQRTRCSFKILSHVVGVSSDKTYDCLDGAVGAGNAINETFYLLLQSRDRAFNVSRALQ